MSEERRQYERLPQTFRVEVSAFRFPLSGQPRQSGRIANISAGGIQCRCDQPFEAGEKVQAKVFIPSFNKFHPGFLKVFESDAGQYLQTIAEVAWCEKLSDGGYGLGLRFLDVDEDDWQALKNLIRKRLLEGS